MSNNCYHENLDLPKDQDYGKCKLIHEKCNLCPDVCIYYKIYEEAYNEGYSNGSLGEDL